MWVLLLMELVKNSGYGYDLHITIIKSNQKRSLGIRMLG
jgi:hypothetical protein